MKINAITNNILEAILFGLALQVVIETANIHDETSNVVVVTADSEETSYHLNRHEANRFRQWLANGEWKHHDLFEGQVMGWDVRKDTYQW